MKRTGQYAGALLVLGALLVMFALPVLAAAEGDEAPADTSTTVAPSSGLDPAVEVAEVEEAPGQADWTYRYLVPTGLALAVVVALLTSIRYFTNVVRKRYRIVEE